LDLIQQKQIQPSQLLFRFGRFYATPLWLYRRDPARVSRACRLLPEGMFDRALQAFRRVGNKLVIF
jgi:hypothetical protein